VTPPRAVAVNRDVMAWLNRVLRAVAANAPIASVGRDPL
jgi:hypothetical protein